jgi:hypothetical protein
MRMHPDGSFDDEDLVHEEGVVASRGDGREVAPEGSDRVRSDYVEDPYADHGVPGTPDDLPYDFGVETAEAADHIIDGPDNVHAGFGEMGETGSDPEDDEPPLGAPEERELWTKQLPLIEEAAAEERHFAGLKDVDAKRVLDAEAEGAEEPLPDSPEGESATGAT